MIRFSRGALDAGRQNLKAVGRSWLGGFGSGITVNQALIDEIVSGVLAKLQPALAQPVRTSAITNPTAPSFQSTKHQVISATIPKPGSQPIATATPAVVATTPIVSPAVPSVIELLGPIITAEILERSVRAGQTLRIGRTSILTPSGRDWLNAKRMTWTRQDKVGSTSGGGTRTKWNVILQTVTPTVRSLHEGLRRLSDGWKIELVGQPLEAAKLAINLVSTAECDGVVIFTEQADLIACQANRNERVRAAVMQTTKQWEQVTQTLSANVVCISPIGRTFIELRNLLRDCAGTRPQAPAGM